MTTITRYRCDTCKAEYELAQSAINCEMKGLKNPFPVGLAWVTEDGHISKALSLCFPLGHSLYARAWVCTGKVPGIADTCVLAENKSFESIVPFKTDWLRNDSFCRLCKFLLEQRVAPLCISATKDIVNVPGYPEG